MGADFYSNVIIGVELSPDQIVTKRKVKTFNHAFDESVNFDPISGKKLWRIEEEEKDFGELACEYTGQGETSGKYADPRVVGINLSETGDQGPSVCTRIAWTHLLPDQVEKYKAQIKEVLEPMGLWNEQKFGVYHIFQCSY